MPRRPHGSAAASASVVLSEIQGQRALLLSGVGVGQSGKNSVLLLFDVYFILSLSETFFQRRHTDGQQAHEKMLNIVNHQGNTIKTTMRYHLTPVRMVVIKKITNAKCW